MHKALPKNPTWSTDIFYRNSIELFNQTHTLQLAKRANIDISLKELETYTKEINDFVALVSPILHEEYKMEPLVSLGNPIRIRLEPENPIEYNGRKLLSLAKNTMQNYYQIK
jgi:hypothetical protein